MQEKRSFYLLLTLMGVVALITMAVTNVILYRVAFEEKSQSLIQSAQSQARLIEAIARYNQRTNRIDWELPVGERGPTSLVSERAASETISQLRDAHNNYIGFGETGEFVVAGLENQQIVFLLNHRHDLNKKPQPIPFYSELAEPTRRALLVQSGIMVGKDYRGVQVLAAYEPVDVLNLGIVAKIDLAEIQRPFINGAIITSGISLLVIFAGSIVFRSVTNPIIDKIRTSEHQYRTLVEDIAEWVWETDKKACITYSSPIIEELLGFKNKDLLNKPFPTIVNHVARPALLRQLLGIDELQPINNQQLHTTNREGEKFILELNANPIYDTDGSFKGYRGVARDITSRINAEELSRQYQHNLQTQVEEQTHELKEINEELKSFTYIVSHDLRSPLVSIVGFTAELKEDFSALQLSQTKPSNDNSEQIEILMNRIPESLAYIDKASEKMESLINSVLTLSRLGVREMDIMAVDISEIVDLNLKALAYQLNDVDVVVHDLPVINTDKTSLTQVFGNLLGNAVKYLRPDIKGKIEVGYKELNESWQFYIRDNGCGIAESDIPHIFDLFKRVGNHQVAKGDGMGLTYVQTIIRRLGGKIECHSKLEAETTFEFTLPKNDS